MVKSNSLVHARAGPKKSPLTGTRQDERFVRVPVAHSGLVALADGLNRLGTFSIYGPVKLEQLHLTRVLPEMLTLTSQQLFAVIEVALRHILSDPWRKSPRFLGHGPLGSPNRLASLIYQGLAFYLGPKAAARLKRCEACKQWFADLTRNRNKKRCGLGRCSAGRYWSRVRRQGRATESRKRGGGENEPRNTNRRDRHEGSPEEGRPARPSGSALRERP